MKSQKFINHRKLIIVTFLLVCFIVLLNFLVWKFSIRFDLTDNKAFSVSNYSQKIVKDLDDTITVKAYFSKDLPPQFTVVREQVSDLLNEYASFGSKFSVRYLDPGDGKEAEKAGIPKLQFNDVRRDKLEVASGYFGLQINYRDKSEVIPMIQDVSVLEYQLTSAVKKLTDNKQKIGFSGDSQNYQVAFASLSKIYNIEQVDLKKKDSLKNLTLLVIANPTKEYSKEELSVLDKYWKDDGSILVLYDQVQVDQSLTAVPNKSNLAAWLAKQGIKVKTDLILDSSAGIATFSQGLSSYALPYAYWPKLLNNNFNSILPAFTKQEGVVLPWATAVEATNNSDYKYIVKTSSKAWLSLGSSALMPDKMPLADGKFASYETAAIIKNDKNRLVVVGDADFVKDQLITGNESNITFFQNLVDTALQEDGMSQIRAKTATSHPLQELSDNTKRYLRFANVFGPAVIVLLLGLAKFLSRRKTKGLEF